MIYHLRKADALVDMDFKLASWWASAKHTMWFLETELGVSHMVWGL